MVHLPILPFFDLMFDLKLFIDFHNAYQIIHAKEKMGQTLKAM